jgi:hypothetical protein
MKAKVTTLFCTSLAVLLSATASRADDEDRNREHGRPEADARVLVGFKIAPVPLNIRGKNPALVGLGSYLVNAAGGCNDCHTHPNYAPGGDPFLGESEIINAEQYLTGGRQFGPITSKNLTPDEFGRPAGLTFEEFEHLLRTGEEEDEPGKLLQVMPWPVYGKLSQRDLRAIYSFLSAIPSRPDNPNPGP